MYRRPVAPSTGAVGFGEKYRWPAVLAVSHCWIAPSARASWRVWYRQGMCLEAEPLALVIGWIEAGALRE